MRPLGSVRHFLFSLGLAFLSALAVACSFGEVTTSRHALVYGVSLYQSMYSEGGGYEDLNSNGQYDYGEPLIKNLTYTDEDAISIAAMLGQSGWDDVRLRVKGSQEYTSGTPPTKAQLFADIGELASTLGPSDTVLVYFSGHGTDDNGDQYFIPYLGVPDSKFTSVVVDYESCIAPADLSAELAKLPTNKIIVILDFCFSGGFVTTDMELDAIPQSYSTYYNRSEQSAVSLAMSRFGELLVLNAASKGIRAPIVISAAGSEEESYEDWATTSPNYLGYSHGIFSYFLLQAKDKADINGDDYITTTEAYTYTATSIKSSWNTTMVWNDFMPHLSGGSRDLVLFDWN